MGFSKGKGFGLGGDSIPSNVIYKGVINVPADFPNPAEVQIGWEYTVGEDVTDNDPTKTNTGQSFLKGAEIRWGGSEWVQVGNEEEIAKNTARFEDTFQPNGFRDIDDTFIDFTNLYFQTPITVTAQDSTLYTTNVNLTPFQYTSGIGATAIQIAAQLVLAINGGSEPVIATDNLDGTYVITATNHEFGFDSSVDANQTINTKKNQLGITPDGSPFEFYSESQKYTYDSARYTPIYFNDTPDPGHYFIYFDKNGVLQFSRDITAPVDYPSGYLSRRCAVATVFITDTNQYVLIDNRFGYGDAAIHDMWEYSTPAVIRSGLGLDNFTFTDSGSANAEAQFSVDNGNVIFYDTRYVIIDNVKQELSPIAWLPTFFLGGSVWIFDDPAPYAFKNLVTGTQRVTYNQISGGSGSQVEAQNGEIVAIYLIVSQDHKYPIGAIQGQKVYTSRSNARANAWKDLNDIVMPLLRDTRFPLSISAGEQLTSPRVLEILLVETDDAYTNDRHALFIKADSVNNVPYFDLRQSMLPETPRQGIAENNIYYVRSNGSDNNEGMTVGDGFASQTKGLTEILAKSPTVSNPYVLKTFDAGVYVGSLNMGTLQYTKIDAQNATVKSNDASINSNCEMDIGTLQRSSGAGNVLIKTGTGKGTVKAKKLINTIATGGGIYLDNGILETNIDELTTALVTDTLFSANPANINKSWRHKGFTMRGKIYTTGISDKFYIESDFAFVDLHLNASSTMHVHYKEWAGNIGAAGALSKLYMTVDKRTGNPALDVHDPSASIMIKEIQKPFLHAYLSANQSIGASVNVPIIFDTLNGTPYQMSLNPVTGEITILTNGIYTVEPGLAFNLSAVGQSREVLIFKNSVLVPKDSERQQSLAQDKQNANLVSSLQLKKDDVIRVYGYSDGTSPVISGTSAYLEQSFCKITKTGNFA